MSNWFRGLKYAENIGVDEAEKQLDTHGGFDDNCKDFDKGVLDYILHVKTLEIVNNEA